MLNTWNILALYWRTMPLLSHTLDSWAMVPGFLQLISYSGELTKQHNKITSTLAGYQGRCSDWVLLHTAQLSWPWLWHPLCKLVLKLDQTPGSVPKGKHYMQIIYCFLCDKVGLDAWVMLEPLCVSKGATCGLGRLPKGERITVFFHGTRRMGNFLSAHKYSQALLHPL